MTLRFDQEFTLSFPFSILASTYDSDGSDEKAKNDGMSGERNVYFLCLNFCIFLSLFAHIL